MLGDLARAPVLVLGTLWPQCWDILTQACDEPAQARAVLDATADLHPADRQPAE
jgi:hypothetical protein